MLQNIDQIGTLALGSRLARASDQLYMSMDKVYKSAGIGLRARWFPVVYNLFHTDHPLAITDIARAIGQSHASVSQVTKTLLKAGLVTCSPDPRDERRKLVKLSEKGQQCCQQARPLWESTRSVVDGLLETSQINLLAGLGSLEKALETESLDQRIARNYRRKKLDQVEIIPYDPVYRADFKRLNIEWLEIFFYVEEIDEETLSDPEKYILTPGGEIFFARLGNEIIGTCALMRQGDNTYSLARMGVSRNHQGHGVGRKLLAEAIRWYGKTDASLLYLESNTRLKPALQLYESMGFAHAQPPKPSPYERSNVYMVYGQ